MHPLTFALFIRCRLNVYIPIMASAEPEESSSSNATGSNINRFASDGSFMEMFKNKMAEEKGKTAKKADTTASDSSTTTALKTASDCENRLKGSSSAQAQRTYQVTCTAHI